MEPSSSDSPQPPPDEEDFDIIYIGDGEHGFYGIMQHKFTPPELHDIPVEEQQAAAYRYMQARYGPTSGVYTQTEYGTAIHEQLQAYCAEMGDQMTQHFPENEPPALPFGPTAYCRDCAASGVGVCDAYPNCPAGRIADPSGAEERAAGIYDGGIHRETGGSDPLVQEPGP
jgi:hypothetical protein